MTFIYNIYDAVMGAMLRLLGDWFLPTLARFSFAAVLLWYFWNSAMTKLGAGYLGFLSPNENAFYQIFPQRTEAFGFDISQFSTLDHLVVTAGTIGEIVLPLLIVIGLFTRVAALGMAIFVAVQSLVDILGHGVEAATAGRWFDGASDALIFDQRLMWMMLFAVLLVKGAGPLSLDRILRPSKATS